MTFDEAQDQFRSNLDYESATAYSKAADEYYHDKRIGYATYIAAMNEIGAWVDIEIKKETTRDFTE